MSLLARIRSGLVAGLAFAVVLHGGYYGVRLCQYVAFGLRYGDWLNDWLTYLPPIVASELVRQAAVVGRIIR